MKYKNIIWDWNGTIVDDAWVFVQIMNKFLNLNNLPNITLKEYKQSFCFPIQDYWYGLGFRFNQDSFGKLNTKFINEYKKNMFVPTIHKGITSLLKELKNKNIRQYLLSASEDGLLKESVSFYKLNNIFNGVCGVDNLNAEGKKRLGEFLFNKYSLNSYETLVVGDTEYDYEVAKHLNCSVVLISHCHINYRRLKKTKTRVVTSVLELKNVLKNS